MKLLTALGAAAAAVLLLSACGSDDEPDDLDELLSEGGDYPPCEDIWVEGETLPDDYEGCDDGGTVVDITSTPCVDGESSLYIHQTAAGEDTHFAITGQTIAVYSADAKSVAYEECQPPD